MIIILGNGFDLNLGLKTGYQDFIKSKHFAGLVESGSALAIHLKEKNDLKKWIDIETELKVYSLEVYRDNDRRVFKAEYKALCQSLCNYLNALDYNEIDIDSVAYNLIISHCQGAESTTIYNFNYTKSADYILAKEGFDANLINVVQMHGSAAEGNIIFGVEDGADIDKRDVFLLKSASKHFNCDVSLDDIMKAAKNILILGHSLGETDHFYIKPFFQNVIHKSGTKKNIIVTYHTESGYDDIMMQLDSLTIGYIAKLRQNNNVKFKAI